MSDTPSVPADSKPEPDLSGRRLGDYQLMRRLARGGMADVYLAEQQSLRRQVAFKVLRRNLAGDETYVRRFHNEAQAAAALVHANIVQIYEVGCVDGVHFIAQEYVAGQNLKQLIHRHGALQVKLVADIMRQVAGALHRAAARGIIHRDIKPENILLASTGEAKVADFGLARLSGGGQLSLTQVGVTLGTPLYMSPEQVEGRTLDHRSDLYSFGVTCYEMLAGRPPFSGDSALTVAVQHLKGEPPRLEDLRTDVPGGLSRMIHKMLAKKPAQRYQDAAELLRDLRSLEIDGLEGGWPSETSPGELAESSLDGAKARTEVTRQLATVMTTETTILDRDGRKWWLVVAIVVAFFLGAAAAWVLRPPSLLAVAAGELPPVERKLKAEDQFWHAMNVYTEAAFRAVIDNFPPEASAENEVYADKAKLQLAYIYRENGRRDESTRLLEEVASRESDRDVRAAALVALANMHAVQGELAKANQRLYPLALLLSTTGRLSPRQQSDWSQKLHSSLRDQFQQICEELRSREKQP